MSNASDALQQCGYAEHGDGFKKLQSLIGLEAEIFERVIEIKATHKDLRKAAQLVTRVPGTLHEKDTAEIVGLIKQVEGALERTMSQSVRGNGE